MVDFRNPGFSTDPDSPALRAGDRGLRLAHRAPHLLDKDAEVLDTLRSLDVRTSSAAEALDKLLEVNVHLEASPSM